MLFAPANAKPLHSTNMTLLVNDQKSEVTIFQHADCI